MIPPPRPRRPKRLPVKPADSALMKRLTGVFVAATFALAASSNAQASLLPPAPRVIFSHATMTAGASGGDSALVLSVQNASPHAITLLSITDAQAASFMFFRATSIITSTQAMHYVADIVVPAHHGVTLSYQRQGAMIAGLHQRIRVGERVPLAIKWSDAADHDHTSFVYFRVVAAPAHLHFIMG